ncbi:MAG: alpha-1,2-fucosyltransferase [Butyrivibrio sp.]|nr:alpha-1,2-fucosyltransferase [Butyrivibrio sp.]
MIIIQLKGGLGNQMFQYALYTALKNRGKTVKIDDETGFVNDELRVPVLSGYGIEYERATKDEIVALTDSKMDIFSRIRRKLTGRKTFRIDEESGRFNPKILELEDAYLVGYWQSDKYFANEEDIRAIRLAFEKRPQEIMNDDVSWTMLQQIECCESVSLHVRRTDYIDAVHRPIHNICSEKYYKDAVNKVLAEYSDAVFFIFTDDKEWCKGHFKGPNFHVVELEEGKGTDIAEMMLMSRCKHHIIANSSFSWWAAWLNDAPEKLIIAPEKWINNKDMEDVYTDRMTKIAI